MMVSNASYTRRGQRARPRGSWMGVRLPPALLFLLLLLLLFEIRDAVLELAAALGAVVLETSNGVEAAQAGDGDSDEEKDGTMIALFLVDVVVEGRHGEAVRSSGAQDAFRRV